MFTETFNRHRQSNQPMETRGAVAEIDPTTGAVTFHATTQAAHALRWYLAMTTNKENVRASVRSLASNRERVKKFYQGAKSVVAPNLDELKKSDSGAGAYQMKRDRSTPFRLGRLFANTLAADAFPRVVAQDIGGAFGSKGPVNREDIAVFVAAKKLNRSVKWIEDRSENLADGGHAREEQLTISVACSSDGEIQGFKVDLVMDQGAYPSVPINTGLFAGIMRVMMPGTYRLKAFQIDTTVVATNKGRYVAYRGPWANETWVRERMLDVVARELGMSPTDLRLKNVYTREQLPSAMITGPDMDKEMTAKVTLDKAIELADLPAFAAAKTAAEAEGRYLGVGFCTFHEAAPGPPNYSDAISPGVGFALAEPIDTVLEPDGTVTVKTQQMPHGQSHETTYAQLAADELGLPLEAITVRWGDTDDTPFGILGTGGSRGGPMGGGAVKFSSRELRQLILEEAADLLEASVGDLQITNGNIHVAGVPSITTSFADVAAAVATKKAGTDGQLTTNIRYMGEGDGGWAIATHVCFVEVDLTTGFVTIPRYIVVEDCGQMINPAIVEGQIRGGVAQGIGAVLYEKLAYDNEANFQASTYMDYLIPTAMEIPEIEIHHIETPSAAEANYRGVGEGGMIAAPAALTNAIEDALASKGVKIREQHLPPTRILELAGVIAEANRVDQQA
ncbi:MAG: molybdopterin cofactor-binding domain-containing protein [Acidimicrobiales bacterium]